MTSLCLLMVFSIWSSKYRNSYASTNTARLNLLCDVWKKKRTSRNKVQCCCVAASQEQGSRRPRLAQLKRQGPRRTCVSHQTAVFTVQVFPTKTLTSPTFSGCSLPLTAPEDTAHIWCVNIAEQPTNTSRFKQENLTASTLHCPHQQ